MTATKEFIVNISDYYRKKNYGAIPETTLEHLKRLIGKDFPIQTAPLNFNPMAGGNKLEKYVSAVCNLNTAVGVCQISKIDIDDKSEVIVVVDVKFFDRFIKSIEIDSITISPVGIVGHIAKTEAQFTLMGFVCYPAVAVV